MTLTITNSPNRAVPAALRACRALLYRLLAASACVGAGIVCGFVLSPFVDGFTAVTAVPFVAALAGMAAQASLFGRGAK